MVSTSVNSGEPHRTLNILKLSKTLVIVLTSDIIYYLGFFVKFFREPFYPRTKVRGFLGTRAHKQVSGDNDF